MHTHTKYLGQTPWKPFKQHEGFKKSSCAEQVGSLTWVWLKLKQEGSRRSWSMFPLTRASHFGTGCFEAQPLGHPWHSGSAPLFSRLSMTLCRPQSNALACLILEVAQVGSKAFPVVYLQQLSFLKLSS